MFTPSRKAHITRVARDYQNYLTHLGFEFDKQLPPIGVRKNGSGWGYAKDDPLAGNITISEERIDHPEDDFLRTLSRYYFNHMLPLDRSRDMPAQAHAINIVSNYFRMSFLGHKTTEAPYPKIVAWDSALWELRSAHGKDFMDHVMFYAVKRWQPYGANGEEDNGLNDYFRIRLVIGVETVDNDGTLANSVITHLKQRGLMQP